MPKIKYLISVLLFLIAGFIIKKYIIYSHKTEIKEQQNKVHIEDEKRKSDFLADLKRNSKVYNTDSLANEFTNDTICKIVFANFDVEDSTFYVTTFPPFSYLDTAKSRQYFGDFGIRHRLGYSLNINRIIFLKPIKIEKDEESVSSEIFYKIAPYNSRYYKEFLKLPNSTPL